MPVANISPLLQSVVSVLRQGLAMEQLGWPHTLNALTSASQVLGLQGASLYPATLLDDYKCS